MKKKIAVLLLVTSMVFSIVACGTEKSEKGSEKQPEKQTEQQTEQPTEQEPAKKDDNSTLSAEKNLLSVEVTLPASLIGEESNITELTEEAKENGVKEITQNSDGSVTLKMTKEAHKKLLDSIKQSIDESIAETLADKENCPSFDSISYNDDVTVFEVKVDPASFGGLESIYALTYYIMGNMYQALNAVPENDLKTVVNFVNKDTGEVIQSGDSTQMGNAGETGDADPSADSSSDNTSTGIPQLQMLDDATKNAIKEFVEPCISDTYKTSFYTCDVLTPTEGSGGIVSVQIESPAFADEGACKEAISSIVGQMLGDVRYQNINSFEFFMLADSQMKYMMQINDAQVITSANDINDLIETTGF